MSRLDSHIHQKIAQRDSIDLAACWLARTDGLIVEFGLGNGRSYSHLLERFPDRDVFCFDRRLAAHPKSQPPVERLILGEFDAMLADPAIHARFAGRVMLLHLDVGSGGPEDDWLPEFVVGRIHGWLTPAAVVLSDLDVTLEPAWGLTRVDTSAQVAHAERYHVYRRRST